MSLPLVMLVDDVDVERAATRRVLQRAGYATVEAADGLDALAVLDGSRPDLILLDMSMPDLDGLALLQFLRADARWRAIPVVVVTGFDDADVLTEARASGACEHLLKSEASASSLLDAVERHVGWQNKPGRARGPADAASPRPAQQVLVHASA